MSDRRLAAHFARQFANHPWLVPVLLTVAAFLIRWPHFTTIPAVTDETDELLVAHQILTGGLRPLTTSEPYLSGVWVYLLAGAFAIAGPSFEVGRLVPLILGTLLVPATWALGRYMAGPWVGTVAGLLTLFAFGPVLMGSHVAWSHGIAPTFVALALALLVRAASGRRLALVAFSAGLVAGLAMGMHPTVATVLAGAAAWWLVGTTLPWRQRAVGAMSGAAGLLVGYSPILTYLALNGTAPFRARLETHDYVAGEGTSWLNGAWLWCESLARNFAGPAAFDPADPRVVLTLLGLAAALAVGLRRRAWLPAAVIATGALLTPLLVDGEKFTSLTGLRSAAPAVPAAAVALALAAAVLRERQPRPWLVPALVALAMAGQAASLGHFYDWTLRHGVSNVAILATVDGLAQAVAQRGHEILLDDDFETKLIGGGEVGRAVADMLTLRSVDFTKAKVAKIRWFLINGQGTAYELLLSGNAAAELGAEFALEPVIETRVVPGQVSRSGQSWGWYHYRTAKTTQ